MRKITFIAAVLATMILTSCNGLGNDPVVESKDGMANLIGQLKDNFGSDAAFSSIIIFFDPQIGNSVVVQGNGDKSSNILIEKQLAYGNWQDKAEITMELESGKIEDFLYTLEEVDLNKIPDMVKGAKEKIKTEKNIEDLTAKFVQISMPNKVEDKMKDLKYMITIAPTSGGTSFHFTYDLTGKFLNLTY